MRKNFVLIGASGFIAPRHVQAIKETGNSLVAVLDPHDSVGMLDRYFFEADLFLDDQSFDRHIESLKQSDATKQVQFFSICSPNHLHDGHIRSAFNHGADAISIPSIPGRCR